jgi:hypothetical protein
VLAQIVHGVVRALAGTVVGAAPGAVYAAMVGAVHVGVYGRWDRVPAFAVGSVVVGALVGLLGGVRWALSGEAAPDSSPRSTAPLVLPARRVNNAPVGRRVAEHPRWPGLRLGGASRRRAPVGGAQPRGAVRRGCPC